jgi:DNA-directed RNA polymerase subunit F
MSIIDIDILLELKTATEKTGKTRQLRLAVRRLNEINKLSPEEFENLVAPLYKILK